MSNRSGGTSGEGGTPVSGSPAAATVAPAGSEPAASRESGGPGLRVAVGQRVEVEVYGTKVTGSVVRSGDNSVVIDGHRIDDLRRLRLGVSATVTFGVTDGAIRIKATLGPAREGISLQFVGPVQMINRRAHPRAAISAPVEVVWTAPGRPTPLVSSATTIDLSAGGVRFCTDSGCETPAEGTLALLTFRFPDRRVTLPARVLATGGTVVRAQFSGPLQDDVAGIDAMVLQHLMNTDRTDPGRSADESVVAGRRCGYRSPAG